MAVLLIRAVVYIVANIGPNQLVYNRELEAIARAAEVASHRAKPSFKYGIYSGNKASLLRLAKRSDLPS